MPNLSPGKSLSCWVLCAVILGVSAAGAGPDPRLAGRLAAVDSMLAVPDAAAAAVEARNLWDRFGTDPVYGAQIAGRLGLALVRVGKVSEAVPWLEKAVRERPAEAELHRNLAYALQTLGRRGRALAEYETAARLAPADFRMRLEYGQVLLEYKSYSRAEKELSLAWRLCDGCLAAEQALANLYLQQGDPQGASVHLARIWEAAPSARVRLLYASALARSHHRERAYALLDSVPRSSLQPDEWRLLVQMEKEDPGLGVRWSLRAALSSGGDVEGALPVPLLSEPLFWAVVSANLQGGNRPEQALAALDRALALAPDNIVYMRNRVVILRDLGREDEARREWEKVLRLDPDQKPQEGTSP